MYTSWLIPPPNFDSTAFPKHAFFRGLTPTLSPSTRAVLIGLHPEIGNEVRGALYALSWDLAELEVVDLGNLRKRTIDFAIPLLRELHRSGITPILLGGRGELYSAQYLAFGELNRQVGIFSIDQRIRLSARQPGGRGRELLDDALYRHEPPHYHLSHAGSQRQLIDPELEPLFTERHYGHYSLGRARANLADLEPPIRDADVMLLDIAALLHAEAPAQTGHHPSGFSLQEASQLCYYAGNSDRLSSFGVYGFDPDQDSTTARPLTASAYAQLVWYFLHGMSRRYGDFPATTTGMVEYLVDTRLGQQVTFWRSPRSNRWWVAIPVGSYAGEERNRLVACSHQDYLSTSELGQLPDRVLSAFARY